MNKNYYYHFNNFDASFAAVIIALLTAVCLRGWFWLLLAATLALWCYKHIRHKAVVINDNGIKIDHCALLAWQDIKSADIITVRMGHKDYKILSLTPRENIRYRYNWLQKHNCRFGAFAVPLYGILSPADEEEIVALVRSRVP